ncbi:ATPase domain-containing protein [Roseateles chitinivorans]|uniref:ATPase domain-containing protein n=1 Tax=Roseateles chitinivorans TaxID=2917965 RepID=UPI003D666D71
MSTEVVTSKRVESGIPGLDAVLRGGLPASRFYLLEGPPGTGKTTVSLQFLRHAAALGEKVLYVTLSETAEELSDVAASHGWDLDGISLFEFSEVDTVFSPDHQQTLLHPWELELGETIKRITDRIDDLQPTRVVFDSLSELRLLAQDSLRYRRQVLALKQYFATRQVTVLLTDDLTGNEGQSDAHLHSLCHGVISLERLTLDFGGARRRLQVRKLRGVDYVAGFHDFVVLTGGAQVFPRLIASDHAQLFTGEAVSSGLQELDAMMDGGPLRGTSTLFMGPAGSGKTNLALQFVHAACERGEPVAMYEFDERIGTLLRRAELLGLPLRRHIDAGLLELHQVDPAQISPGQFDAMVVAQVERRRARMIVVDSLTGYMAAMPQEQQLILQLHELLAYLNQQGVTTLLLNAQQSLVGTMSTSNLNVSYVADAVLLLRFFEHRGRIRKALSIIKNRGGAHEESIRELRIDKQGIRIGEVLDAFHGVLTGVPTFEGQAEQLMEDRGDFAP